MALLEVEHLTVSLPTSDGWVKPVDDVSFTVSRGEILSIVGESGCGKSTTALAVMRLLAENVRIAGQIRLDGADLLQLSESEMCALRGNRISMIFQEPMTALNPVKTIGFQIMEPLLVHTSMSRTEAREKAIDLLARVGIDQPARRINAAS
ncbi:MAG: ABC transporter ATP-binding protein [Hyphomicrobium sp.]|nr:ABC transporter ATP-binding protein [Hyphomicrobium sp.]